MSVKHCLDTSAQKLIAFLDKNRIEERFHFPFSYSFPRNCCEGVSLIFRYLAFDKYGLDVEVLRGRKRNHETHFWNLTSGGLIYDLTCSQFPRTKPVIGLLTSPTWNRFSHDVKVYSNEWHVERTEVIAAYRDGVIPF